MKYFLLKSEPTCFSIDDLAQDDETSWTGVRNYQARNTLRDDMQVGDLCFFYHSNCEEPGIVGLMKVASEALPDTTALNIHDEHYDPKSTLENPIWITRTMEFVEKFKRPISLHFIKNHPELSQMVVAQKGSRLSITAVNEKHFERILQEVKK
ncbi:EVE domain-containing protein [Candidatus Peribacteria bacterium]|nr:EVE domain-containing protein [Candidatus Peribacteria bacterium]